MKSSAFEISSKVDVARSAWRRSLFSVPVERATERGHGLEVVCDMLSCELV